MNIDFSKQVFAFELDDVLYPKRDYMLQVYYLFAQFLDFSEGSSEATTRTAFMKDCYDKQGEESVFEECQKAFGFPASYKENFERLRCNAQLPLPLLLLEHSQEQLLALFQAEKQVVILTKGNPVMQLNKMKHLDWGLLNAYKHLVKVYFVDELTFRSLESIPYIAQDLHVDVSQIQVITNLGR